MGCHWKGKAEKETKGALHASSLNNPANSLEPTNKWAKVGLYFPSLTQPNKCNNMHTETHLQAVSFSFSPLRQQIEILARSQRLSVSLSLQETMPIIANSRCLLSLANNQHNTELLVNMVRQQFKRNKHEIDPEKIQKLKDDAARGLINHILYEAERLSGRRTIKSI
ncbi:hypothetical protein NC651_020251 [Populus alba x Populus x berolinensis]|nr:hypothetical protein NC651_020251 [Populus alba x Populus x berolinensis]